MNNGYHRDITKFRVGIDMNSLTIPRRLYKTSPLELIPPEIEASFHQNERMLGVKVEYYTDQRCEAFLKTHYDEQLYTAYRSLIPGAYRADLWRYCILFRWGGVYGDFSQTFLEPFDLDYDTPDLILALDRPTAGRRGIQIAFIAAVPENKFLEHVIKCTVKKIQNRDKGNSPMDLTGPTACCSCFEEFFNTDIEALGLYKLRDPNGDMHTVKLAFREVGGFLVNSEGQPIASTKMELLHNKWMQAKERHYSELWYKDRVFIDPSQDTG